MPVKESTIDVSVIIINYNTPDLLFTCLSSIYKHTHDLNFEVIVVDNNSSNFDQNYFKTNFSNTAFILNTSNVGFSAANNLGLKHAKGSVILLLNSDTELNDNVIKKAYLKLTENKEIGVVTVKLIDQNGKTQCNAQKFPSFKIELIELFRLHRILSLKTKRKLLLGDYADYNKDFFADWVWGTFFMFNKNQLLAFEDHQLSQRFFMYFEDMEWCYLFSKTGQKIMYSPCGYILHQSSASTQTKEQQDFKIQMQINNYDEVLSLFFNKIQKRLFYLIKVIKHLSYAYVRGNYRDALNYMKLAIK